MKYLFWFSIAFVIYVYAGYPILLSLISRAAKRRVKKGFSEPHVSVILSVFNEEKKIGEKLHNLLRLDYPEEKLEILIGSDGASDATDRIISEFHSPRVRFFKFVSNFGKPNVLRALVREAKGSILLFTDARQRFDINAVRSLVQNFEDPEVGCVSGELYFEQTAREPLSNTAKGMNTYWNYEKFLRKRESEIGSMLGATGAIYAIRKNLFPDVPADILVDDMYIPLAIIEKGYRAVFESEARAYESRVSKSGREEFTRKVRTLAGNYQILTRFPGLFNPFKSPIAWQIVSHKLLRLVMPFALAVLLVTNLLLAARLSYFLFFAGQVLFYSAAALEARRDELARSKRKGIGYIPYTFCLLNYSAFMGMIKFLRGNLKASWEKAYV